MAQADTPSTRRDQHVHRRDRPGWHERTKAERRRRHGGIRTKPRSARAPRPAVRRCRPASRFSFARSGSSLPRTSTGRPSTDRPPARASRASDRYSPKPNPAATRGVPAHLERGGLVVAIVLL